MLSGAAKLFAAGALPAAGATAFGYLSARRFGVRYEALPLLPRGAAPFRILHIGDMHLVAGDRSKSDFVRDLVALDPDFVVNTGDNPGGDDAVDDVVAALKPLLEIPGVFVPGSNDLYGPRSANPLRYLRAPTTMETSSHHHQTIDVRAMFDRFMAPGQWHYLANETLQLPVRNDLRLMLAGTHDAHMHADQWPGFGRAQPETDQGSTGQPKELKVAVTHAPYRRVLDAATADGADLVFAGHTHGGQVALPAYGAIVSNCDLPTGFASGMTTWRAAGRTTHLHVTAGIGASPTVPLRTFCPPEAVVIDLVAASD
ncbi:metallophosphoesterase [Enteractinococcus fodinae]